MRDVKTIEDLREIFADELAHPRQSKITQSAPFRNPRIYQEDYVRHVLRVNIPLNESYPWSHNMRLLIEKEEKKAGNWFTNFFGGVFDFIVGLPSRILGVLKALKDLMLDPGQIRALAKDEEERVKRFIAAAKKSGLYRSNFNAAAQKLEAAMSRAAEKVRDTKSSMEAALGMVVLALTVRYKGVEFLNAFRRGSDFEDVMEESLINYRAGGLSSVLFEARVKLSPEGRTALGKMFSDNPDAVADAIEKHVDANIYKPPSAFDDGAFGPYFANAKKAMVDGPRDGEELDNDKREALENIFRTINKSYHDAADSGGVYVDPIIAGKEFDFGNREINKAFKNFISTLDQVSSGKPQSGFMDFWGFLGSLSGGGQTSGIGEGVSMLWKLVRKYGKRKASKPEEASASELAGLSPDQMVRMAEEKYPSDYVGRTIDAYMEDALAPEKGGNQGLTDWYNESGNRERAIALTLAQLAKNEQTDRSSRKPFEEETLKNSSHKEEQVHIKFLDAMAAAGVIKAKKEQ